MVVEEFSVELDEDEDSLLSFPERWFTKLSGQRNGTSFVTALEAFASKSRNGCGHARRAKTRPSKGSFRQGYRVHRLINSLLRQDMKKPPLCIFCLDDGVDVDSACGRLQWCPDKPLFFAAHELCTLMAPEVVTIDSPSALGRKLFDTDIKQLNEVFARGRKLTCHVCREKGALVGCSSTSCGLVFHLPCAIRENCFINYEEFQCYCGRHSALAFREVAKAYFSKKELMKDENDLCCLCMDQVERKLIMHSTIQTACCGNRFYHYDCMKNATLIRGQEMRCPACNRPNEETNFEETIKRQGIYFQTYNPPCESDEENSGENCNSRCYYAMMRTAAKDRTCLSILGPDKYDDSDALNDQIFNPLEALNGCITCGVHCHRLCAGPPWSTYSPDDDGEEEKWQCDDCRETTSSTRRPLTTIAESTSRISASSTNAARRNQTRTRMNSVAGDDCEQVQDENRNTRKRTRSDALQGKSEGPAKKQLLISDWFSGTRRRTGSSASDLQIL